MIVNISFVISKSPKQCRTANIILVFKKENKSDSSKYRSIDSSNYRSISFLFNIRKIFEKNNVFKIKKALR